MVPNIELVIMMCTINLEKHGHIWKLYRNHIYILNINIYIVCVCVWVLCCCSLPRMVGVSLLCFCLTTTLTSVLSLEECWQDAKVTPEAA